MIALSFTQLHICELSKSLLVFFYQTKKGGVGGGGEIRGWVVDD